MHKYDCILLVDDDDISNFVTERTLLECQVSASTRTAANGQEALRYLREATQNRGVPFPDLILLDINMPVMNGFDFLDYLQDLEPAKNTKVMMLSSTNNIRDIKRARQYEVVAAFISKPLRKENVAELF